MPAPIITFTSDFGLSDWFVGVVHGVDPRPAPGRPRGGPHPRHPARARARAAFVLEAAARDFPAGVVHLAVVDPGVGTDRRALVVEARGQAFVGPDNGVLEWALGDALARVHAVTESRLFRQPVSRTFHARDVSAPERCAARVRRADRKLRRPHHRSGPRHLRAPAPLEWPAGGPGHVRRPLRQRAHQPDRAGSRRGVPRVAEADLEVSVGSRVFRGWRALYRDARVGEAARDPGIQRADRDRSR